MTIDPMLVFYVIMVWLLVQVPLGIVLGWWMRGRTK